MPQLHRETTLRMRVWLAFAAVFAVLGGTVPHARAYPDKEKIIFDNSATDQGAFAAAVFTGRGYFLLANRNSGTVSFFDMKSMLPLEDFATGAPVVLPVVSDPVSIAIYTVNSMLAYAFVAGYSSNKISVISLGQYPPAIMAGNEINLVSHSDTSNPGPVALLVSGGNLFVAAGNEGTILQYDVSTLPVAISHVALAAGSQVSAKGNMVPCVANTNPAASSARPRVLVGYGAMLYAGCHQGTVASFDAAGIVITRSDIAGLTKLQSVRGLAGDPRAGQDILYVLDDTSHAVFALDVAAGGFNTVSSDPIVKSVCSLSNVNKDFVPLSGASNATALTSFADASANGGGNFIGVLTASSTAAALQFFNVNQIDKDTGTAPPKCGLGESNSALNKVDLTVSKPFLTNAGNTPAGIGQQMPYWLGYLGVPGYSSADGTAALVLASDNPKLEVASVSESAINAAQTVYSGTVTLGKVSTLITWSSDKSVEPANPDNQAPTVDVQLASSPLTQTSFAAVVTTTSSLSNALSVTINSSGLIAAGLVSATSNELLTILITGSDQDKDVGFSGQSIIFDTTLPTMPANSSALSVGIGDSILNIRVSGADDPVANNVRSGVGGFLVHLTAPASDYKFYPSTNGRFTLTGLTNDTDYTFDIYAVDAAGNVSATFLSGSGKPVPGEGIISLTGEQGCTLARPWTGLAETLLILAGLSGAWLARRRGERTLS